MALDIIYWDWFSFATAHRFIQPWRHICKFSTAWCTRISRSSTSNAHRITPSCPYMKQPVVMSWTFVLVWVLSRVWGKVRFSFIPYFHVMSVLLSNVTNQSIKQWMLFHLWSCPEIFFSFSAHRARKASGTAKRERTWRVKPSVWVWEREHWQRASGHFAWLLRDWVRAGRPPSKAWRWPVWILSPSPIGRLSRREVARLISRGRHGEFSEREPKTEYSRVFKRKVFPSSGTVWAVRTVPCRTVPYRTVPYCTVPYEKKATEEIVHFVIIRKTQTRMNTVMDTMKKK